MPELRKIETSAAYTPSAGEVVEYLAEEDGKLVLKVKKSDGTEETLSGGSGVDTSDATATAADVPEGLVFYGVDGKTTGTMPEAILSSSKEGIGVTAGYVKEATGLAYPKISMRADYDAGTVTVGEGYNRDEVTFQVGKQFYKCASVDTASKTWTGYRAFMKDGGYSFETELTEGLFCDEGYTPAVGTIYSEDAMIVVKGLWQNVITEVLVFRASFASSITAETGQEIVPSENIQADTDEFDGKSCAKITVLNGYTPLTVYVDEIDTSKSWSFCFYAAYSGGNRTHVGITNENGIDSQPLVSFKGSNPSVYLMNGQSKPIQKNTWYHITVVGTASGTVLYMDGVSAIEGGAYATGSQRLAIQGWGNPDTLWLRDVRFYNRALTADEIATVMREGDGTTVEPDSPSINDPVFFAPLASDVSQAETGQALTTYGNVTFKSTEAVPCAVFSGNSSDYISFDDTGMPDGSSSRTISLLVKRTASITDATLFNYGSDGTGTRFGLFMHDSKIVCGIGGTSVDLSYNFQINTWYCLTALLDKNAVTLYVNGENIVTNSLSTTPNTVLDSVGYLCHRNGNPFTGEIANLRVYDRLLTPAEIQLLANEFTPSTDDPVFYAPLSEASDTAETGQTLAVHGTVTYSAADPIPCAQIGGGSYLNISPTDGMPTGTADRTFVCWAKTPTNSSSRYALIGYGPDQNGRGFYMEIRNNTVAVCGAQNAANEASGTKTVDTSQWHHYAIVYASGIVKFYLDGEECGTFQYTYNTGDSQALIGVLPDKSTGASEKYIASAAIYNRALTDSEIATLASEFTPNA